MRWGAVLVGFVGVVFILHPGSDAFSFFSILPLAAAAFYALLTITAKLFDDEVPSALLNLYSSVISTVCAAIITLFIGGFTVFTSFEEFLWLVLMGGFGGSAVLLLVTSYRMTEQSNLAPFSYFGILNAFLLGWIFFGEFPIERLFPGVLLIVFSGFIIIWRERQANT